MIEGMIQPSANCCGEPVRVQVPTMRERLERKRIVLLASLADVDAALGALNQNPDVEAALDLVQKATY